MTLATGDMNRTKRRRSRKEPWSTPVDIVVQDEDDESILTKDVRYVKINPGDDIGQIDQRYAEACGEICVLSQFKCIGL